MSPEFTHSCRSAARPVLPTRIDSSVSQNAAYPDPSMFAQASAASVAASSTAALPVSVRRNWRSGVSCRAHAVRSENGEAGNRAQSTAQFSPVAARGRQDLAARTAWNGSPGTICWVSAMPKPAVARSPSSSPGRGSAAAPAWQVSMKFRCAAAMEPGAVSEATTSCPRSLSSPRSRW